MGVDIHSLRDGGVSEQRLNLLGMLAPFEEDRGEGGARRVPSTLRSGTNSQVMARSLRLSSIVANTERYGPRSYLLWYDTYDDAADFLPPTAEFMMVDPYLRTRSGQTIPKRPAS